MTDKIKTRAEAKAASVKKWVDILDRINKLANDIDAMCGFCDLAQGKAEEKMSKVFRCKVCEIDARRLCDEYINDGQLITAPLSDAWDKANDLLTQLRSLPDEIKPE